MHTMILSSTSFSSPHFLSRKCSFNTFADQTRISKLSIKDMQYSNNPRKIVRANYFENKTIDSNTKRFVSNYSKYGSDDPHHVKKLNIIEPDGAYELLRALFMFSGPYVLIGTVVSVASLCLLPLTSLDQLSPGFFLGVLKAIIPAVFMTVYSSTLNQVYDVEIDKVNKPDRPLPSGLVSMKMGVGIVSMCFLLTLTTAIMSQSPPLVYSAVSWLVLLTAYSVDLPFLRWKSNTFLTIFSLVILRGGIIPIAMFVHIQKYVLGQPVLFTRSLVFTISFISLFTTVVLLCKDIPDEKGDRLHGIKTFTIRVGAERVLRLATGILMMAYGIAIATGASSAFVLSKYVTVLGHFSLASIALYRSLSVNLSDPRSGQSFYMFIWKLLYVEYFLIQFVR